MPCAMSVMPRGQSANTLARLTSGQDLAWGQVCQLRVGLLLSFLLQNARVWRCDVRRWTMIWSAPWVMQMWVSCWLWGWVHLGSLWVWVGQVSMRRVLPRKRGKGRRGLWRRMRGREWRGGGRVGVAQMTGLREGGTGMMMAGMRIGVMMMVPLTW